MTPGIGLALLAMVSIGASIRNQLPDSQWNFQDLESALSKQRARCENFEIPHGPVQVFLLFGRSILR
jgi:hypothetical protein